MAQFIGHFHPLFVHLPIGILMLGILFDWMSRRKQFANLAPAVGVTYLLGAMAAVASCLTGYLLASSGEYEGATLEQHRWLGISLTIIAFAAYLFKMMDWKRLSNIAPIAMLGLLSITGHLGGSLTHGEEYLFVHAPEPIKSWFVTPKVAKPVISNVQEALVYEEIIVPILTESCYKCHNDQKQKGKLRLDSPEHITKGGKSGAAIVQAGLPKESEMIRRLLLPKSDDKHMPPNEKDELNEEEVALIHWWIAQGADYTAKVNALEQDETISPILKSLEQPAAAKIVAPTYPDVEVRPPDEAAIAALQAIRAVVLPVEAGSNLLAVNFVNVHPVEEATLALLKPIQENIVWLRMSGIALQDEWLNVLGEMPNLTKLYLDETGISDAALPSLENSTHLNYLNLVGTNVGATGVQQLAQLPKLKQLYLFQTAISSEEKQQLMEALPNIVIDTGGYVVPTFAKDTTYLSMN